MKLDVQRVRGSIRQRVGKVKVSVALSGAWLVLLRYNKIKCMRGPRRRILSFFSVSPLEAAEPKPPDTRQLLFPLRQTTFSSEPCRLLLSLSTVFLKEAPFIFGSPSQDRREPVTLTLLLGAEI